MLVVAIIVFTVFVISSMITFEVIEDDHTPTYNIPIQTNNKKKVIKTRSDKFYYLLHSDSDTSDD
jgi:hypothetical protein